MMAEYTYLIKIGLALLLSLIIGFEREQNKKSAGLRDICLVTLGATLFSIISLELVKIASQFASPVKYDMGRIIAYTIVSMGFLGSGVIMQNKDKLEGITTAGTLWAMVAVGILCGIGIYPLAIISALCVYAILKLKYIRVKIGLNRKRRKRRIK